MERVKQFLLGVLGLAMVIVGAAVTYVGLLGVLRGLWHMFLSLPKEVAVATVAASATVFASALAVVFGQYMQRRATSLQDLRKANAPMYEQWVKLWFGMFLSEQTGRKPPTEQEVMQQLAQFSEQLMLWGSDHVVREWVSLRLGFVNAETGADSTPTDAANAANLVKFAKFMKAIRRDMGHRNWRVSDATLLGLFINDAQETLSGGGS